MDLLSGYGSSDEEDARGNGHAQASASNAPISLLKASSNAIAPPSAPTNGGSSGNSTALVALGGAGGGDAAARMLAVYGQSGSANLPADIMYAPGVGPVRPYAPKRFTDLRGTIAGSLEGDGIDKGAFEAQMRSFAAKGYAADPSGSGAIVGDAARMASVAAWESTLAGHKRPHGPDDTSADTGAADSSSSSKRPPTQPGVEPVDAIVAHGAAVRGANVDAGNDLGQVVAPLRVAGAVKRARLDGGTDAGDVDSWKGPWAGFAGEAVTKVTALQMGLLSEEQKKLRVQQGYNADRAGKLNDQAAGVSAGASAGGAGMGAGGPSDELIAAARAAAGFADADATAGAGSSERVADAPGSKKEKKKSKRHKEEEEEEAARAAEAAAAQAAAAAAARAEEEASATELSAAAAKDAYAKALEQSKAEGNRGLRLEESWTTWHGKEEDKHDYQGRSWVEPPKGLRADVSPGDHACYVPNGKLTHTYSGHSKGVQSIQFYPGTGHLLLSGSMDGKVKIWDVCGSRNVKRTYLGHSAAVRQVAFSPGLEPSLGGVAVGDSTANAGVGPGSGSAGRIFLSCSYDRHVKCWDTETGKCLADYSNGKVPYCVTFCPTDNNVFLVGSANRKLVQYDLRTAVKNHTNPHGTALSSAVVAKGAAASGYGSYAGGFGHSAARYEGGGAASSGAGGAGDAEEEIGTPVLEYNYHLGPVNTITFVDQGRRIVSTSDDKKILVWEYNAPVPIKYIQDPSMHAIGSVTHHATEEMILLQSFDNSIQVYHAGERGVSLNKKKRFAGHVTAGFACQIGVSPDGQHICSGDGEGNLWLWDWKTQRFHKKLPKCHAKGPCIGAVWHPVYPSMVATCGWDGLIKLWE